MAGFPDCHDPLIADSTPGFLQNRSNPISGRSILGFWLLFLWLLPYHVFASEEQASVVFKPVVVVDDSGRSLRFTQSPRRIVSLAPHITELLFAAGAGDRIVAVSRFSDYPEAAKNIPVIGDAYTLNIEMLVALKVDLVLVWQSGNSIRTVEMLERLGIRYFFSDPKTVPGMIDSIRTLGHLLGDSRQANRRADQLQKDWKTLQDKYSAKLKVRVFYQVWREPLFTISNPHIVDYLIQNCAGENVFSNQQQSSFRTQLEAVIVENPEVIFFGGLNRPDEQIANWKFWQRFPQLSAVKNNHLVAVPDEWLHRPSPRLLDGALYLCERLDAVRNYGIQHTGSTNKND